MWSEAVAEVHDQGNGPVAKSPGSRTVPLDLFSLSVLLLDLVGYIDDLQRRWFEAGVPKGGEQACPHKAGLKIGLNKDSSEP